MIRKICFIFALLLLSHYFIKPVFSLTPATPFQVDCGYADDPATEKCCDTSLVSLDQTSQEIKNQYPVIGGLVDTLINSHPEKKIPFYDEIVKKCHLGDPDESSGQCICKQTVSPTSVKKLEEICTKFTKSTEQSHCVTCARGGGILTGIGCVPLNIANFISDYLLSRLIGLAGIIALLCIIYSAFQLQTSQGNPEKIKKAQELLTSCIMGLMLIIFSIFILRLVGVDILKIPGFS